MKSHQLSAMLSFSYIYDFETGADSITIILMSLTFVMALCNLYWLCSGSAYLSVVHGFHCLRPQSHRPRNQLAILWKPPVTREKSIIPKRSVSDCWGLVAVAGWNLSGDIPKTSLWLLWLLQLTVLCMEDAAEVVGKHSSLAIQAIVNIEKMTWTTYREHSPARHLETLYSPQTLTFFVINFILTTASNMSVNSHLSCCHTCSKYTSISHKQLLATSWNQLPLPTISGNGIDGIKM